MLLNSYVYIGDSLSCKENEEVAGPLYNGGFIELEKAVQGRYVCIRREDTKENLDTDFEISEVRLYQTPNLLSQGKGGVKLIGTQSEPEYSLDNLIENYDKRFNNALHKPFIDSAATEADFESCYVTNREIIDDKSDGVAVLTFDFGKSYMMHALLII